ncbi:hypothetical protein [Nostoc sp. 'Peltigera membranacea cyanobiont' 210A]|nr:hypothetical protein [Nostoc sp. 'Peltigera membranacea cyanobiont' 210A]
MKIATAVRLHGRGAVSTSSKDGGDLEGLALLSGVESSSFTTPSHE